MNKPSIKTLSSAFPELTPEQVRLIRDVMDGNAPKYCRLCGRPFGRTETGARYICPQFNDGKCYYSKMEHLNSILGGYGVEFVAEGKNQKSPAFRYCDMGDSYATTIVQLYPSGRYIVSSWGDIVERGNYE